MMLDAGKDRSTPLVLFLVTAIAAGSMAPVAAQCDRIPSCELVWSDEFEGDQLDVAKWVPQTGTGTNYGLPAGWGNSELQYYQAENATVAEGFLTITAREQSVSGSDYTSARLRTLGLAAWTYGRMEMRAKMPIGQGLWPAFWMLPSDTRYGGWAASGEIDIVEFLGSEPRRIHGTIHFGDTWPRSSSAQSSYDLDEGSFNDDFHVFAIEWERGEIRWYVDGILYGTQTEWFSTAGDYPAPFDVDFHLLLNLAVGGNWPGAPDSSTTFPQELVVDYVRVYQSAVPKSTQAATAALVFDKPTRMKKVAGDLVMTFTNQARTLDRPGDDRRITCEVDASRPAGWLAGRGNLGLQLAGTRGSSAWSSRQLTAKLDGEGRAVFEADAIGELVSEALGAGATIERLAVSFDGAGRKKISRAEVYCWQRPD
jgi:beta-glucanase (GH16 family)